MDRETRRTLRALAAALRSGAEDAQGRNVPSNWYVPLGTAVHDALPDHPSLDAGVPVQGVGGSHVASTIAIGAAAFVEALLAEESDRSAVFAGDLVEQAQHLADDQDVHLAAPIVLAGAAVEQRLRAIHAETFAEGDPPPQPDPKGMTQVATNLRSRERVSAQVVKDVTTIGGNRNAAAHGDFDGLDRATARTTVSLAALVLTHLDSSPADDGEEPR